MLMPRKVAHRKHHRGRMKGNAKGGNEVSFGDFGIQALEPGWITARQIEAARIAMTRHIKRGGKVWINIFPDSWRTIYIHFLKIMKAVLKFIHQLILICQLFWIILENI